MPTEPWHELLDPERDSRAAPNEVALSSAVLREIVAFGTHMFARCGEPKPARPDESLAPLRLYHHILEMTDAVEVLLRERCAIAAKALIRSQWEADLQLVFMTMQERFGDASLAWWVSAARRKIIEMREHVDHERREKSRKRKRRGLGPRKLDVIAAAEARRRIARLESGLRRPHLAEIAAWVESPWYKSFGGGATIEQLALAVRRLEPPEEFDRQRAYGVLYRPYSSVVHGSDFDRMLKASAGVIQLEPLRSPGEVRSVASLCASLALEGMRVIVRRMRPDLVDQLAPWYVEEVQEGFLRLTGNA
jgi:hypothetical protein